MPAPRAPEIPHELNMHGDRREDPYFWMSDRASPAVIEHLEAENAFVEESLQPLAALRGEVLEELKARLPPADESVPFLLRGYEYFRRFTEGKEYPVYCRRRPGGAEEILLDVNELATGREYTAANFPDPSPDSTKIMYAADFEGRRIYTLFVKDLLTGEILAEVPRTTGNAEWANDSRTIFFSRQDPQTLRACEVHRHELGGVSELVFEEKDETFDVGAKPYPAMLITAGFHDSQVQYWEAAKWAAKLRQADASVLLFTEMGAGHGGASGRYRALEQTALEYTFLLQLEGITA